MTYIETESYTYDSDAIVPPRSGPDGEMLRMEIAQKTKKRKRKYKNIQKRNTHKEMYK